MKAEVIARGLIIEGEEIPVGKVIEVSKKLFDRSTKLVKPGGRKNPAGPSVAEQALAFGQKKLAEDSEALSTRAEELDAQEEDLAEREKGLKEREKVLKGAEQKLTVKAKELSEREVLLDKNPATKSAGSK